MVGKKVEQPPPIRLIFNTLNSGDSRLGAVTGFENQAIGPTGLFRRCAGGSWIFVRPDTRVGELFLQGGGLYDTDCPFP